MKEHQISPDLVEAVGWLKAAYTSYRIETPTLTLYSGFLADLPPERVAATIRFWIANEPKFPSVADIRLTTIRKRIGAPPAYEAFNQVKARRIKHDLVQHAFDTIGGMIEWERDPKFFPGRFLKLYNEIVDREVREFNEFSLNGHSDYETDQPVPLDGLDPGANDRGGDRPVLVRAIPERRSDHLRRDAVYDFTTTLPPQSLDVTLRSIEGGVVQPAGRTDRDEPAGE